MCAKQYSLRSFQFRILRISRGPPVAPEPLPHLPGNVEVVLGGDAAGHHAPGAAIGGTVGAVMRGVAAWQQLSVPKMDVHEKAHTQTGQQCPGGGM